ncbi:DinB family protein [Kribbella sp. DT2]|uniref:DinB family protein n=1 Tax=Kribbella sp. DT2 TaxID=3393427 RepID=UPI003CFA711A
MTTTDQKSRLHEYLRFAREAMLWKLEGLSEYDVRRPLTPTGTNLLGLIKHLTLIEGGYFGDTFGRPFPEELPFGKDDTEKNWATADESRDELVDLYRRVIGHADATIDALELDSTGSVPWWGENEVTLFGILVHVLAEVNRHAGHADILREGLDGAAGLLAGNSNMMQHDEQWWKDHHARIQQAADTFR